MSRIDLTDAAEIKRVIVDPVVEGVEDRLGARIAALETSDARQQKDIEHLKRNQGRALAGLSVITLAGSTFGGVIVDKLKRAMGWH